MTWKALDQFPESIQAYESALKLQPANPEIHQNLGVVWMKQGNIPESLAAFKRSIELYQKQGDTESRTKAEQLSRSLCDMGFEI